MLTYGTVRIAYRLSTGKLTDKYGYKSLTRCISTLLHNKGEERALFFNPKVNKQ
jgi:hypothetical protein